MAAPAIAPVDRMVHFKGPINYKRQSVAVPGTKRPGQTAHYQNEHFGLVTPQTPNSLRTLTEVFDNGLALSRDRKFLGYRPKVSINPDQYAASYSWETYGQIDIRRRAVGSALRALFNSGALGGGETNTVGTWSQNRPEWQIVDLAVQAYGLVGVSLYDTLGKDSVEYIINHSHLTVIFVTQEHIAALLKLAPKLPTLKLIISIDDLTPQMKNACAVWAETQGLKLQELRDLEATGRANPIDPIPATFNQIVSICYTSGTTNLPKGVILTHGMLSSAAQANLYGFALPEKACLMSYLPLAHIYERLLEVCTIAIGGSIGYFTGDPLRLLEDAQVLKPEVFPSVPRVLNRIYQAAMLAGNVPGLKGGIFRRAIQVKTERLHATGNNTHALWDKLVFRKIAAVLGGRLKTISSGSAPISAEVMDFLKISLGGEVIEGRYGMTENCATCCRSLPQDPTSSGTVGPPQTFVEVKLIDVPAMGYTAEDKPNPRGELCSRGAVCFNTYYKDEKNTKDTIDEEGWLHTGDVAEIDACGRVKVIDRVKNIMKLSQGEYVALENIENIYSASPVVAQFFVHGDSMQSFLIAVIVPDPVQLANIYGSISGSIIRPDDGAALSKAIKDPQVSQALLAALTQEAKKNGLRGFETVKRIHITLTPFSTENGTMTPTFKIKRKDAYQMYRKELEELYALGEPKL